MQEQTAGAAEGAARRQEGLRMRGSSDAGVRSPEHAGGKQTWSLEPGADDAEGTRGLPTFSPDVSHSGTLLECCECRHSAA